MAIVRNIVAVIVGMVAGMLLNIALIFANLALFPLPEGVSMDDTPAMAAWMADLPQTAFLLPVLAHLAQAFGGGWVAARLGASHPRVLAMIIGVFTLLGGVINLLQLPGPIWMWVEVPLYVVVAWMAGALEARRRAA